MFIKEKEQMRNRFNEQLLQSRLEMQEQTFNTISSEIHDNVGQILSLAKVQLNIMGQVEKIEKSMVTELKETVGKAMTDLRDIARSLNSDRIQRTTLQDSTKQELLRISNTRLMTTSIDTEGETIPIPEQRKLILFRMIQEGLQNIIKHSRATHVEVLFDYRKDPLIISISDNGIGFDQNLVSHQQGLGLQNMLRRASVIGGEATIDSAPDRGTVITFKVPFQQ